MNGEQDNEFEAIHAMLARAKEYGLEVEVVSAYGEARATGVSVQQACWEALYEWDL